ncbi:hypothetical protein GCM10022246_26190 [Pedobacter ginsengiterrae]|uniref:ATPase AAA-type core domain-containing protein n=1 Tax=Pedobacter ginsengiterrae TaxID=871696 RepID=A0ABP7PYB4_9SPHI
MYYFIPLAPGDDLISRRGSQVNILVGENGSGKSSLLRELSSYFARNEDRKVIAIANTIHDKFDYRHRMIKTLKASNGKALVRKTLKIALQKMFETDNGDFQRVARTLEYVNFNPTIGIKVVGLKPDFQNSLRYGNINEKEAEIISLLLMQYNKMTDSSEELIPVNLYRDNFLEFTGAGILELLNYESLLKRAKIIRDIEVYLNRDGRFIIANQGSSGELTLITTFVFLAVHMDVGARILIDEPENSLHPKWQTEYVRTLYDLVYQYEPRIYIATHSPLIVNSAEIELGSRVSVFKSINGPFELQQQESTGVEELYQELFDVTTPENRFLSETMVKKMNQLSSGVISYSEFQNQINELSDNAYDPKQKSVLGGVLELGSLIIANRN